MFISHPRPGGGWGVTFLNTAVMAASLPLPHSQSFLSLSPSQKPLLLYQLLGRKSSNESKKACSILSLVSLVTNIFRRELSGFDLAKCNDGSTAAYYHQQVNTVNIHYKIQYILHKQTIYCINNNPTKATELSCSKSCASITRNQ